MLVGVPKRSDQVQLTSAADGRIALFTKQLTHAADGRGSALVIRRVR